jgi:hypothetical protein
VTHINHFLVNFITVFIRLHVADIEHYELYEKRLFTRYIGAFYKGLSKSFRTDRLKRELQMIQLPATRCSCIAILWVSLVSFAAITLCVASQRVFIIVDFVIDSVRKIWTHPRIFFKT